jgi:hypothetical protein
MHALNPWIAYVGREIIVFVKCIYMPEVVLSI